METKPQTDRKPLSRDERAQSESRTAFLLGLVFVLSVLFVALEWNFGDSNPADFEEDDEEIMEDLSLLPHMEKPEFQAAPRERRPEHRPADRLKAVDQMQKPIDLLQPDLSGLLSSDMKLTPEQLEEIRPQPMAMPGAEASPEDELNKLPEFPGGMSGYIQWLSKHLRYPLAAQRQKQQGTAMVSFVVTADGKTSRIKLESSSGNPLLDREALRVIRFMPQWKPGTYRGKASPYLISVPVVFKL